MKYWVIIPVLVILLLLGGCSSAMEKKNNDVNIAELTEAYLEERYGEPFTYASAWDRGFSGGHNLLMRCESVKDDVVAVHIIKNGDGSLSYEDNYLPLKFQQPVRDFLRECALSEFSDARVFYTAGRKLLSGDVPADLGFDAYLAGNYYPISATIEVPATEFKSEEQATRVAAKVAQTGVDLHVSIVSLQADKFGTLDMDGIRQAVRTNTYGYHAILASEGGNMTCEWVEGDYK